MTLEWKPKGADWRNSSTKVLKVLGFTEADNKGFQMTMQKGRRLHAFFTGNDTVGVHVDSKNHRVLPGMHVEEELRHIVEQMKRVEDAIERRAKIDKKPKWIPVWVYELWDKTKSK